MYLIIYDRFLYLLRCEVFLYGEALCKVDGRILRLLCVILSFPAPWWGARWRRNQSPSPCPLAGTVPRGACQASPSPFPLGCLAATLTVIPLPGRRPHRLVTPPCRQATSFTKDFYKE